MIIEWGAHGQMRERKKKAKYCGSRSIELRHFFSFPVLLIQFAIKESRRMDGTKWKRKKERSTNRRTNEMVKKKMFVICPPQWHWLNCVRLARKYTNTVGAIQLWLLQWNTYEWSNACNYAECTSQLQSSSSSLSSSPSVVVTHSLENDHCPNRLWLHSVMLKCLIFKPITKQCHSSNSMGYRQPLSQLPPPPPPLSPPLLISTILCTYVHK